MRAAREARGWSQGALAGHAQHYLYGAFDQSAVARIEAGDRRLRLNEAVIIARLLDIDLRAIERPELGLDSRMVDDQLARLTEDLKSADEYVGATKVALENAQAQHSQALSAREAVAAKLAHLQQVQAYSHRFHGEASDGDR